jgi:hypothetical protein
LRAWHQPTRYSPYSLPSQHRLYGLSTASRYSPQSGLQYHAVPSNFDYNPYATHNASVDWTRHAYQGHVGHVGPYSPYPDDEESSPYTTQPPSFILPNTDPMSTNSYHMHSYPVRPQPSTFWPEAQQNMPQPNTQLTSSAYNLTSELSHAYQGGMTADRTLPHPYAARTYMHTPASSIDIPVSTPGRRDQSYWNAEASSVVQQLPTPVEGPTQEQISERMCLPYQATELSYGQLAMSEQQPTTTVATRTYYPTTDTQSAITSGSISTEHTVMPQQLSPSVVATERHARSRNSSAGMVYNCPPATSLGPQLRSASGQMAAGPLYCRTTMLPGSDASSDECSPDCSSCKTTESTRTASTSASSTSAGC